MSKWKFETLELKIKIFLSLGGKPSTGKARQDLDEVLIIKLFKKKILFSEKCLSFKIGTSSTIYEENWRM